MYLEHYGLNEPPFSITPDPRFVFLSERHRDALAHLLYGISQGGGGGFVQLTGEVGTGKTTVCRLLLEQLPANTHVALLLNPRINPIELLEAVCEELRIPLDPADGRSLRGSSKALVDALNAYLLGAYARGERIVLIIDEAQNLSVDALEQVRLLTNLETDTQKLLQIALLGQPELRDMLARPELRQLAQRITARYHLTPLTAEETGAYLRHRFKVAGGRRFPFDPGAVKRMFARSGGIPRLLNVIAERALLAGYARDADPIDAALVDAAADEALPSQRPQRSGGNWMPWMRGPRPLPRTAAGSAESTATAPAPAAAGNDQAALHEAPTSETGGNATPQAATPGTGGMAASTDKAVDASAPSGPPEAGNGIAAATPMSARHNPGVTMTFGDAGTAPQSAHPRAGVPATASGAGPQLHVPGGTLPANAAVHGDAARTRSTTEPSVPAATPAHSAPTPAPAARQPAPAAGPDPAWKTPITADGARSAPPPHVTASPSPARAPARSPAASVSQPLPAPPQAAAATAVDLHKPRERSVGQTPSPAERPADIAAAAPTGVAPSAPAVADTGHGDIPMATIRAWHSAGTSAGPANGAVAAANRDARVASTFAGGKPVTHPHTASSLRKPGTATAAASTAPPLASPANPPAQQGSGPPTPTAVATEQVRVPPPPHPPRGSDPWPAAAPAAPRSSGHRPYHGKPAWPWLLGIVVALLPLLWWLLLRSPGAEPPADAAAHARGGSGTPGAATAPLQALDQAALKQRLTTEPADPAAAWANLLALWNQAPSAITISSDGSCAAAAPQLQCLRGRDGRIERLLALDRPVLLPLRQDGIARWAVLLGADADTARLALQDGLVDVDRKLLLTLWNGDYFAIWHAPDAVQGALLPGERGPGVAWLREQLGLASRPDLYDATVTEAVRRFQETRGLLADGQAGAETQMALADPDHGPHLLRELR